MVGGNLAKAASACGWCLRHPGGAVRALVRGLATIHRQQAARRSPLRAVRPVELVGRDVVVRLSDFTTLRDGNTSLLELAILAAAARRRRPHVLLEIGTFDGMGALTLARNSPQRAVVHTIDLPAGAAERALLERSEVAYVRDTAKSARKFAGTDVAGKVVQWIGDSTAIDFDAVLDGRPLELAFVDGGHAYDVVARDSENVLERLAPDGVVLWHDYAPVWPGVVRCLDELGRRLPLRRVEGTALVVYDPAGVLRTSEASASA